MHYYLEKGYSLRELSELSTMELLFLTASMMLTSEEVQKANGQ